MVPRERTAPLGGSISLDGRGAIAESRDMDKQLYIDGAWTDGTSGESIDVINPSTEQVIATVPQGSVADVERAVLAARRAFEEGWGHSSPRERQSVMRRFFQALKARQAD